MTDTILPLFGLRPEDFMIERIGSGHIHLTYKLSGQTDFILQRVNKNVFRQPELIASNLRMASDYLSRTCPDYNFLTCIRSVSGKEMEYDAEGFPWRLFPFIGNTITIDSVSTKEQAFHAASEFARLTRKLEGIDVQGFRPTIPRFHDLTMRWEQFEDACSNDTHMSEARELVDACKRAYPLVDMYRTLTTPGMIPLRIVHNDTKINNVLFDRVTGSTSGVIDLDTLMPGYILYDLGDMVRTFVSPVSEEERSLDKISFRKEIYDALLEGYLSEMGPVMTEVERRAIPLAGPMMTYIMALRFLADFLRGNVYYHISYPEQNLVRASNQLRLLDVLSKNIKGAAVY